MGLKHLEDVTYFRLNNEINRPVNGQIMLHKDQEALEAFFKENVEPNTKQFLSLIHISRFHPQNLIQIATKFWSPNFTSIARRYSGHSVCVENTSLHPVEAVIPAKGSVCIALIAYSEELPEHTVRELTLEFKIMDGQDGFNVPIRLNPMIFFLNQERNHRSMVIVNVEDIWDEINPLHQLNCC